MRGIYAIVGLSTTREDVSFTFQIYNDRTGLNTRHILLMRYIGGPLYIYTHMMDVIWEF